MLESFTTGNFEYKKLSLEEQKSRGILGRLAGIIADSSAPTRNGRLYSSELWEKVFENNVMQEKINNHCLFGELGHPVDREEVDMEKVAICLSEQPKKGKDGKLYGVFDILSTPNGRILKALCDYGCNIGVSSRGTGDLYTDDNGNEAVDPDTYNCECWDAVVVPAVESARLHYVNESLENKSLKTVLKEELDKSTEAERKVMIESLNDIAEKLDRYSMESGEIRGRLFSTIHDLAEEIPEAESSDFEREFKTALHNYESHFSKKEVAEGMNLKEEVIDMAEPKEQEVDRREETVGTFSDGIKIGTELKTKSGHRIKIRDITVNYDGSTPEVTFIYDFITNKGKPGRGQAFGKKFYDILDESLNVEDSVYIINESNESNTHGDINLSDTDARVADDKQASELAAEFVESMARLKKLDKENLELKEKLSVSYAKETELKEALEKHKAALIATSSKAKEVSSLKESNSKLHKELEDASEFNESIAQRLSTAKDDLNFSLDEIKSINESRDNLKAEVSGLKEELNSLNSQLKSASKELAESKKTITRYQKALKESKAALVEAKAEAYGISVDDVKSNLKESYKIEDLNKLCEDLSDRQHRMNSKLPFRINANTKIKSTAKNESILGNKEFVNNDDEVSDSLLRIINM